MTDEEKRFIYEHASWCKDRVTRIRPDGDYQLATEDVKYRLEFLLDWLDKVKTA